MNLDSSNRGLQIRLVKHFVKNRKGKTAIVIHSLLPF